MNYKNKKILFFAIPVLSIISISPAQAVFCTVYQYIHPETRKERWLFGDVHCDISPFRTCTNLQQDTLITAAKKRNALMIVENYALGGYNPYFEAALSSVSATILYAFMKYKKSGIVKSCGCIMSGALLGRSLGNWYFKWLLNKKPPCSMATFLAAFKKCSPETRINFFRGTPLQLLVEKAQEQNVEAIDIEFRYHMLLSVLLNETSTPLQTINFYLLYLGCWFKQLATQDHMRYQLTLRDYCTINDAIVTEIQSYHDAPVLNDFYHDCIRTYQNSYVTKELYTIAQSNPNHLLGTVVPPLAKKYTLPFAVAGKDFIEHNMALLDARAVHNVDKNASKDCIFICTGVEHTQHIARVLEKLGYTQHAAWGKDNLGILTQSGIIGSTFMQVKDLDHFLIDLDLVFTA